LLEINLLVVKPRPDKRQFRHLYIASATVFTLDEPIGLK